MSLFDHVEGLRAPLLNPSGGCRSCPLRPRKPTQFVPATLRRGKVLFLGEAPGKTEVETGEGFTGRSGQLLRRLARDAEVPEPWSFSNTVHCRPEDNATPRPRETECCLSEFVLDEIRGYDWVVMAGTAPLTALFPGAKGNRFRGNVAHHPDFPGQKFYAVWHPAYTLRRPDKEPELVRQLRRLGRLVRGEDPAPEWEVFRGGGEAYWQALDRALSAPLLSLDVETNTLESWQPTARIISLALTADGREVIFAHEKDPSWIGTLERVRGYLENPAKQVVGHNVGFDLDFLEREVGFRIRTRAIHDTATVWYEAGQYKMPSLKELVALELDGYRWLVHHPSEDTDPDLLTRYNCEDVVYPLQLFRKGMAQVKPRTRDLLIRVAGPSGYVLRKMATNGNYIRPKYWREKLEEYQQHREDALAAWKAEDPTFVPTVHDSGDGLIRYLHEIRGLPVLQRTGKTGKPSTDKSVIKALVRDHGADVLRHLLRLKEIEKIESTYLEAYRRHVDAGSGCVHSSYPNTWTDSARTSSRSPNLQNIPRNKEIRNLFGSRWPGGVILESDLSQIEFRIMVCLAEDQNGIAGYLRGDDAHTMTARSFCAGAEPTKEERTNAKAINFALLYEGDWFNVQRTALDWFGIRWTEAECRRFVRGFFETYPKIKDFHARCHANLIRNRGWFESVTGHVFHYRDWDHPDQGKRDHAHRSAINSEAQGPAAQLCLLIAVQADRLLQERGFGEEVLPVNHVHDSVIFDVADPSLVPGVVRAVEDAREIAHGWARDWMTVPLVMDHEVGPAWGSMEPYRPEGV